MVPAPVFVQMSSESTQNLVLREPRKLRCLSGMDRVYIKPDHTEAERVLEKQLRTRIDARGIGREPVCPMPAVPGHQTPCPTVNKPSERAYADQELRK